MFQLQVQEVVWCVPRSKHETLDLSDFTSVCQTHEWVILDMLFSLDQILFSHLEMIILIASNS